MGQEEIDTRTKSRPWELSLGTKETCPPYKVAILAVFEVRGNLLSIGCPWLWTGGIIVDKRQVCISNRYVRINFKSKVKPHESLARASTSKIPGSFLSLQDAVAQLIIISRLTG